MAKNRFVNLAKAGGLGDWLEKPKGHESFTLPWMGMSDDITNSFD